MYPMHPIGLVEKAWAHVRGRCWRCKEKRRLFTLQCVASGMIHFAYCEACAMRYYEAVYKVQFGRVDRMRGGK